MWYYIVERKHEINARVVSFFLSMVLRPVMRWKHFIYLMYCILEFNVKMEYNLIQFSP